MRDKPTITKHESTAVPRMDQRALKRGMKKLAVEENARCPGAIGWGIQLKGGRPSQNCSIQLMRRVLNKSPRTAEELAERIQMKPQTARRALQVLRENGEAVPNLSVRPWEWTAA